MSVEGRATLQARANGQNTEIKVLISKAVEEDMLISWRDLINLKVISSGFPNVVVRQVNNPTAELIKDFPDVLNDELDPKPMITDSPMRIHLKDDAIPKKVTTARRVPLRYEAEANRTVQKLIKRKVIAPVSKTTEWCSPAFFVPKGDKIKVRLVTDYTHLNKYVKRPVHPFPSTKEILQAIPADAKFFAKLDAVHGYFQLAIDEASALITTFLLPQGKFMYLRAPMGLNASSDEWCLHSDRIIIGLEWARKIVDDTLIWARTMKELMRRIRIILERCREFNITISKEKLEIGQEIHFAGHIISHEGIRPDDAKFSAIKDFPTPKNLTELRGFLGLAQQLGSFIPDLAQMTSTLRPLTKKGVAWQWLEEHQTCFLQIKQLLTSKHVIKPFDQNLATFLLTDASRLHGLGFALMQEQQNGTMTLVQCGSKSLTDTQQRYATIEIECLGIQWAINKCDFYLRGLEHFTVLTDHKPLKGIFEKELHQQENPRLRNLREKIQHYNFSVQWVAGKTHFIADALSRSPIFRAADEEEVPIDTAIKCLQTTKDPCLNVITDAIDHEYEEMIKAIETDRQPCKDDPENPLREAKDMYQHMSVENDGETKLIMVQGSRIFVPRGARKSIIKELHRAHSGYTKTITTARQLFYWPGMRNELMQAIDACQACQADRPTQARTPLKGKQPPSSAEIPMKHVGADLFDVQGKDWLTLVDRYSGYAWAEQLRSTNTRAVINSLSSWFNEFGWPDYIRTDGGPQFREEFKRFCKEKNIMHELSSAYNPESNGLAEAAVKNMKKLILRCKEKGENIPQAIAAWRNMARADGLSPSQLFYGRRQKQLLPLSSTHKQVAATDIGKRDKAYRKQIEGRNAHTGELRQLDIGEVVRVQDNSTKKWTQLAVITEVRRSGASYTIQGGSNRTYIRSRRHLKPTSRPEDLEMAHSFNTSTTNNNSKHKCNLVLVHGGKEDSSRKSSPINIPEADDDSDSSYEVLSPRIEDRYEREAKDIEALFHLENDWEELEEHQDRRWDTHEDYVQADKDQESQESSESEEDWDKECAENPAPTYTYGKGFHTATDSDVGSWNSDSYYTSRQKEKEEREKLFREAQELRKTRERAAEEKAAARERLAAKALRVGEIIRQKEEDKAAKEADDITRRIEAYADKIDKLNKQKEDDKAAEEAEDIIRCMEEYADKIERRNKKKTESSSDSYDTAPEATTQQAVLPGLDQRLDNTQLQQLVPHRAHEARVDKRTVDNGLHCILPERDSGHGGEESTPEVLGGRGNAVQKPKPGGDTGLAHDDGDKLGVPRLRVPRRDSEDWDDYLGRPDDWNSRWCHYSLATQTAQKAPGKAGTGKRHRTAPNAHNIQPARTVTPKKRQRHSQGGIQRQHPPHVHAQAKHSKKPSYAAYVRKQPHPKKQPRGAHNVPNLPPYSPWNSTARAHDHQRRHGRVGGCTGCCFVNTSQCPRAQNPDEWPLHEQRRMITEAVEEALQAHLHMLRHLEKPTGATAPRDDERVYAHNAAGQRVLL